MMKKILFLVLLACFSLGFAQNVGDYQSTGNGNWTSSSTWIVWNGSAWVNPATGQYPGNPGGNYRVKVAAGSSVTVNPALTLTIGDLYIEGFLRLEKTLTLNPNIPTPNLYIINGTVVIDKNESLILPSGTNIYMNISNASTQGFQSNGGCTGDTSVVIGGKKYSTCQGNAGSAGSFNDVNTSAASGIAVANANPTVICQGGSVQLIGSKIGNAPISNLKWEMIQNSSGPITPVVLGTGSSVPFTVSSGTLNIAGTYVFRFSFNVGSATSADTITITVDPALSAGPASATPTLCINTPLTAITHVTTGATGIGTPAGLPAGVTASWAANKITITGTPTASGTFNYSIPLTGGCGAANATGTITVTPNGSAGTITGTSPIFIGATANYTASGTPGGTWSSVDTAVLTVNPSTGLVTAVGAGSALITYSVTGCGGTSTATATVVVNDVTTWNGTPTGGSWDFGPPADHIRAVIAGSYQTSVKGNFTAKDLTVNSTGSLTVDTGNTVTVVNGIINNGVFTVKPDGNLIQVNNISNTGAVEVQKIFTFSGGRGQYNYVSSPTVNTNVKSVYTGILDNSLVAQYHIENTNTFGNSSGAYIAGRALALKEPLTGIGGSSATNPAKFIGVPFNGPLNYPLAYTTNRPGVTHGYNLVGNPYPSNLDLVALYNANSSRIESTVRFWDNRGNTVTAQQGSGYQGQSYAQLNAATGTAIAAATTPGLAGYTERLPSRYVSPAQGFMVKALSTANGQALDFSNTMRVSNPAVQFFGKTYPEGMDRYWLGITTPNHIMYSAAVIYYEGGSHAVGVEDTKASVSSDNIFTMAGADQLAIHGRPPFSSGEVLSLGYSAYSAGRYTVSVQKAEGVFAGGQSVYLKDRQTGTVTDLSRNSYSFDSEAGEYTGRFAILYRPETKLATGGAVNGDLQIYRDGGDFVVQSPVAAIASVQVYDAGGRLAFEVKGKSRELRFKANPLPSGIYYVKVRLGTGNPVTRKIRK